MSEFKPRLKAPDKNDPHWVHISRGGRNSCIHIGNGSCLPNCVGYAWGRWDELLGTIPKLSRGNAENWWNYKDGYARGQTPKLGAVICWSKGKVGVGSDGAGHVAIVEKINKDGSIVTSNSAYRSTRFYTKKLKPPYNMGRKYSFQGFIYCPIDFDETTTNNNSTSERKKSVDYIAREVICGKWGNGAERKRRLEAAGYDYQAVQKRVNEILLK